MTDSLLTMPDKMERLSLVYVSALAARAGYSVSIPSPDRDSVDMQIQAGGDHRPALDLQLKATSRIKKLQNGLISFQLSIKNYEDLRLKTHIPRLLVVLELPRDEAQWMAVTMEELILRRRAYWLNLRRHNGVIGNQQSVAVRIPNQNIFDVESLQHLMERSRTGDF